MKDEITIKSYTFPTQIRFIALLFGLTAIALTLFSNPGFVVLVIAALGAFTGQGGVQLDFVQNRFRDVLIVFGIKFGDWKSLENFTDVAVLGVNLQSKVYTWHMIMSTTIEENKHNVCILTKDHRRKEIIQQFDTFQEAENFAIQLSKKADKQYSVYSPRLSEETKARRRGRR